MRRINEARWWEDGPLTLYHGTSSVLLPQIREHGLQPPPDNVEDLVRGVLTDILPNEAEWPPGFLEMMTKKIGRNRSMTDRTNNGRRSLYFFPSDREETPSVRGYARGYAQIGGEMSQDVWSWLNAYRKDEGLPVLPPRWPEGKPVVIEVEVPREWCLWHSDPKRIETFLRQKWDEGDPRFVLDDNDEPFARFEDVLDDVLAAREVRVPYTVPPSMIRDVKFI